MKNKIFAIFMFLGFVIIPTKAEIMSTFSSNGDKIVVLSGTHIKKPTDRPKLPELQSVTCFNDEGLFIIEFAVPEGECYIYIETWEGGVFDYYFDSSELISTVYVGKCKEASIRITTEWGNEYYGLIPGE